jgi:hypothetical protein
LIKSSFVTLTSTKQKRKTKKDKFRNQTKPCAVARQRNRFRSFLIRPCTVARERNRNTKRKVLKNQLMYCCKKTNRERKKKVL